MASVLEPAPGPHQGFFSDVTQFDLTDFAGQKRDLRTMEPVAGEVGHCFLVGARHQLRASMSAGRGCRLDDNDNLDILFAGKNSPWRGLGRASMPGRRGREAPMPGRNVLESISGTCAFEVPRTGNRHQPFFGCCPRGVRNWKQACPIFFSELPRVEFRVEFSILCPRQD